jgi:hypothetical protein
VQIFDVALSGTVLAADAFGDPVPSSLLIQTPSTFLLPTDQSIYQTTIISIDWVLPTHVQVFIS